ncbi:hypothetical protein Tco_1239302 [Tanacetum coccineum]
MTNTYQQSLADAGLEIHPPMLEKGNYVPWSSRFLRFIDGRKENRKFLRASIFNGPYVMKEIDATTCTLENPEKKTQNKDDLTGDEKKYEWERHSRLMNEFAKFTSEVGESLLEWSQYITNVRLLRNLHSNDYDLLFDHLQQYEVNVNALRAKRATKAHDPLALDTNTYASSLSF